MALRRIQRRFQRRILGGGQTVLEHLRDPAGGDAVLRLDIYANAYRLRLLECMGKDFPGLKALAGEDLFNELGNRYIATHPSRHFNIRWYGSGLAEFLARTPPYNGRPMFSEMAAFEKALATAFDAADDPAATEEGVARLPSHLWPVMVPVPHASVQRLRTEWDVAAFWKSVSEGNPGHTPSLPLSRFDPPAEWMIWRQALKVYYRRLSTEEAWALDAALHSAGFGEICDGLRQWNNEDAVAARAAEILKSWLKDGLLHKIRIPRG